MAGRGKQQISVKKLEELERELSKRARAIAAIKTKLKVTEQESLEAMGLPMVERGLDQIDRFILSCRRDVGVF